MLHALEQLNKIPLMEQRGQQERLHLKSLRSKVEGERDMSFLQAFLTPIQRWADKQLGDYHLHFSEVCYFSDCCRDCAVLPSFHFNCQFYRKSGSY